MQDYVAQTEEDKVFSWFCVLLDPGWFVDPGVLETEPGVDRELPVLCME